MKPTEILDFGRRVLDEVLVPAGFRFVRGAHGPSSGGDFARGAYVRSGRRLEFSVRSQLGLVTYRYGAASLSHEEFMRAVLRGSGRSAYPGFDEDPREAFVRLARDLRGFAGPFVAGDRKAFLELVAWVAANPRATGLRAIDVIARGPS